LIKHYLIDGNNLIGKIESLKKLHKKDKQLSRIKLAFILERYFSKRKAIVSLFFDGFENEKIKANGISINYSGKVTADEKIKKEIERSTNPKNIILISSDRNLLEFAKVCSCTTIKCEEIVMQLNSTHKKDEEQVKIAELDNIEEFKNLFGVNQIPAKPTTKKNS
jgi:predicted RNA-binding protein with PIN domain